MAAGGETASSGVQMRMFILIVDKLWYLTSALFLCFKKVEY